MMISDNDFLNQFENQTLDPAHFNHIGHLRLAWLYLHKYSLDLAIEKITSGISLYASSLGADDKFQHTLTEAIVRIMAKRMRSNQLEDFLSFLAANKDLVEDLTSIVAQHYSDDVLNSELARSEFIEPNLSPF